jgi:hypothetical protein
MDPNANLKEQLELVKKIIDCDQEDARCLAEASIRLAELVLAMDTWLSSGGFAPTKWAVMT